METQSDFVKYPRTPHLAGSGIQRGDEEMDTVPLAALRGLHLTVTEKMDGANCGISFAPDGTPRLQSRGHYLTGGGRERQFDRLKAWMGAHAAALHAVLTDRYILFGEWLYAKHTAFYTRLPDYFLAFDCYERRTGLFLDTPARDALLAAVPFVRGVRVVHTGPFASPEALPQLVGPSPFVGADAATRLRATCAARGLAADRVCAESDLSGLMEGVVVKVETNGVVQARYKYVRPGFRQTLDASGNHWASRPIIPNELHASKGGRR